MFSKTNELTQYKLKQKYKDIKIRDVIYIL